MNEYTTLSNEKFSGTNVLLSSSSAKHWSLNDVVMCEIKGFNSRVIVKGRIDGSHREMVHHHIVDYKEEVNCGSDVFATSVS
ncbi:hypothetical protein LguiA_020820 [Lonicera macranthoides]